jgi:hypothetical protein
VPRRIGLVALLAGLLAAVPAQATDPQPYAEATADASPNHSGRPAGRPTVKLDRLDFPKDVPNSWYYRKELLRILRREARRMDWGAGRGSTIMYRFSVEQLRIEQEDGVLRVSCTAVGRLPKGKTAKGNLSFGGDPQRRNAVVVRVLQIVARGVLTRLAELERVRRGDLTHSGVRKPVLSE